jgi:hypothetical protein
VGPSTARLVSISLQIVMLTILVTNHLVHGSATRLDLCLLHY